MHLRPPKTLHPDHKTLNPACAQTWTWTCAGRGALTCYSSCSPRSAGPLVPSPWVRASSVRGQGARVQRFGDWGMRGPRLGRALLRQSLARLRLSDFVLDTLGGPLHMHARQRMAQVERSGATSLGLAQTALQQRWDGHTLWPNSARKCAGRLKVLPGVDVTPAMSTSLATVQVGALTAWVQGPTRVCFRE